LKLLTILGARPQFIKAATVSRAIKFHDDIEEVIVHTLLTKYSRIITLLFLT
jgi:UDP-GlcNAc3NAcA epimerase